MHIPKFWARRKVADGKFDTTALGWSDASASEAAERAESRARKILSILRSGTQPDKYEYGSRNPLREERIDERDAGTDAHAIVTRNRYGALVLNSARVMFIDIDDVKGPSTGGILNLLFGKKKDETLQRQEAQKKVIVDTIVAAPNLRSVLYRTKAGFRVLVLSRLFDPASAESLGILQSFGSDPLYVQLTKNQKCFRARLSPKPWRIGIARPPSEYPRDNADAAREFAHWEKDYSEESKDWAVCENLGEFGTGTPLSAALSVRTLHDALALSAGKALA